MTNLTPEQQSVVDKAAKDYADFFSDNYHAQDRITSFSKGAEFVLFTPSLYMGLMEEMLEWSAGEGWQTYDGFDRWINPSESRSVYPVSHVVEKFIEHKNKKEDGKST